MTLLEAMSVGKVVIATAVGGNVEVVTDGISGILIPSDDTDALVDNLNRLKKSPLEMHRLSRGAMQAYSERFSVNIMANQYEELYKGKNRS